MDADGPAIFDRAAFDRQTGGDTALAREIVRMFLEDCPQRVAEMRAALAHADAAALVSSAHALKGSAAYLSASAVRGRAADLERLGRESRLGEAAAALDRLGTAVAELIPELQISMAEDAQDFLSNLLTQVGGVAGTVHVRDGDGLRLVSAVNIPEFVKQTVAFVPRGTGMAGIALDTGHPVQTCNLKDDTSGTVRPGARAVSARAAVAMPIRDGNGRIAAVVGVAFDDEREIPELEVARLMEAAAPVVGLVSPRMV